MLNVGGNKMTMKCNTKGCKSTVSVDIIKSQPVKTGQMLTQEAAKAGWDARYHRCPNHK